MTILYRDFEFGAGQLQVSQNFEAKGNGFTATIKFVGHLRVIRTRDGIEFAYLFTSIVVDAGTDVPGFIEDEFRSRFRDDFVGPFSDGLGVALTERINEEVPLGGLLLNDVYINDVEFGLGFCIPRSQFPDLDGIASARIHVKGSLAMDLFLNPPEVAAPTPEPDVAQPAPSGLCSLSALSMMTFLFLGTMKVRGVNRSEGRSV
jgi:hypothetical protein